MRSQDTILRTIVVLAISLLPWTATFPYASYATGPWYVAPGGDDSNNCLNPSTPCATINGAIDKAASGDTIYVAGGTYTGSGNEVVLLDKGATLSGGWDSSFSQRNEESVIDGQGERAGVRVAEEASAFMDSFTVQNSLDFGILSAGTLACSRADDASLATAVAIQVMPRSGVPGTEVRIQGAGFTAASTVTFGGTVLPPASVTFVAPTQLRALVPQLSGLVTVSVATDAETTVPATFSVLTPAQGFALLNATASSLPPWLAESRNGLFMDADGDADLDLFVSEHVYPSATPLKRMRLLMNNGAGQFSDETDTRIPEMLGTPADAESGDVDGDGDEDILANTRVGYSPPSHPGSLLINDGSGHFSDEWVSRVPRVECNTGVLGDVDGDGDLDLLLPCWWPDDPQLFLNDGTGHFAAGGSFPVPPYGGAAFVLGDVDDDGDLDALGAGDPYGRADVLYMNDGQGHFVDETGTRLPDSDGYHGVQSVLADLDGDGDLDGIILGYAYDPEYILINDGTGHFSRSPQQLPDVFAGDCSWQPCYEPGDLDGDGDVDLVIPDSSYRDSIVLINQGNAQFEEPTPPLSHYLWGACKDQGGIGNEICEDAALGDVDNDGALDLFLARGGGSDIVQQSLLFKHPAAWVFLPVINRRVP